MSDVIRTLKELRQDLVDNSELNGLEEGIKYCIGKIDERINGCFTQIEISNNATNGDVIRAMFPKAYIRKEPDWYSVGIEYDGGDSTFFVSYPDDWWKAPYNAECNL